MTNHGFTEDSWPNKLSEGLSSVFYNCVFVFHIIPFISYSQWKTTGSTVKWIARPHESSHPPFRFPFILFGTRGPPPGQPSPRPVLCPETQILELILQLNLSLACELGHRLKLRVPLFIFKMRNGIVWPSDVKLLAGAWPTGRNWWELFLCWVAIPISIISTLALITPSGIKKVLSWKAVRKGKSNLIHSEP